MVMRTVIVLALTALLLAACGGSSQTSGALDVVAAENVYGNIAAQIGGPHVAVTSILTNPNADPHLFEPGTSNGPGRGEREGRDPERARLRRLHDEARGRRAGARAASIVTMADVLGIHGKDANPHLWYDVPQLDRIAARDRGRARAGQDPHHAAAYRPRLAALRALARRRCGKRSPRSGPASTARPSHTPSRCPAISLAAAGLDNLAPDSFTRPIEEGTEPSPSAVAAMDTLIAKHRIRVLLYNSQAVSPITAQLRDDARKDGIPVVPVTETLPPHLTFQQWQLGQARALAAALAKR